MNTEQSNKLIAEFMGGVQITKEQPNPYWEGVPDGGQYLDTPNLKYHSSWDWLMPVVEKCLQRHDAIIDGREIIDTPCVDIIEGLKSVSISETHQAVIEFIKWYNQNRS